MNPPEPSAGAPVIELRDAAIGPEPATGRELVREVNWRVEQGDWWVMAGLHWSGKSALIATAGGVQRPMSGGHWLFGEETSGLAEARLLEHRRRIGIVFEHGGRLFTHLTVAENVALPLCYHRDCGFEEAAGRVGELLELTELSGHAARPPDRLARRLWPRVGLARALALQPDVLLLDNPLAGLPAREYGWWLDLLAALHRGHPALGGRPLTLVVAADDLQPWARLGRQFALIEAGRCRMLGGGDALRALDEPLLRELMSAD